MATRKETSANRTSLDAPTHMRQDSLNVYQPPVSHFSWSTTTTGIPIETQTDSPSSDTPWNHALVFGASGICGWAIMNQCLTYPHTDTFQQITGLTNRPLPRQDSGLPPDPRVYFVNGIDLTLSEQEVYNAFRLKTNIESVTHVFYAAYVQHHDHLKQNQINEKMLKNAMEAVLKLTGKNLKCVVLQTGLKHYGVEFLGKVPISLPLKEDAERLRLQPFKDMIFYYRQVDVIERLSAGQVQWRYYEIRPDMIVGFTPGSNRYSIAQGLAFYLSLYRDIQGQDAEVQFPGTWSGWSSEHQDSFQDIIAQRAIYAAVHTSAIVDGTAFNCPDDPEKTTSWKQKWPAIAKYFGLRGVEPGPVPLDVGTFVKVNMERWHILAKTHGGLRTELIEQYNWDFITAICSWYVMDRKVECANSTKYGFTESVDTMDGYTRSFDRMRAARIIP